MEKEEGRMDRDGWDRLLFESQVKDFIVQAADDFDVKERDGIR
jgi:hypothetical protein